MATSQQLNTVIGAANAVVSSWNERDPQEQEGLDAFNDRIAALQNALRDYLRQPEPGRVNTR